MARPICILFLYGALFGPFGDLCHVLTHTTSYPKDVYRFYFFGLIPYWVPLLFGSATLLMGITYPLLDRLFPLIQRPHTKKYLALLAPFLFLGIYCLSGIIPYPNILLALLAVFTWAIVERTWRGVLLALLTGMLGTGIEIYLVQTNVFSYQHHAAHFWGVPTWLPWLYIIASITVGNLGRFLFENKHPN